MRDSLDTIPPFSCRKNVWRSFNFHRLTKMLEKIAEILTVAREPALKDHITRKCSLSSATFNKYITQLLENGLLNAYPTVSIKHLAGRPTSRRMIYQTSRKGKLFLKRYNQLMMLLTVTETKPSFLSYIHT